MNGLPEKKDWDDALGGKGAKSSSSDLKNKEVRKESGIRRRFSVFPEEEKSNRRRIYLEEGSEDTGYLSDEDFRSDSLARVQAYINGEILAKMMEKKKVDQRIGEMREKIEELRAFLRHLEPVSEAHGEQIAQLKLLLCRVESEDLPDSKETIRPPAFDTEPVPEVEENVVCKGDIEKHKIYDIGKSTRLVHVDNAEGWSSFDPEAVPAGRLEENFFDDLMDTPVDSRVLRLQRAQELIRGTFNEEGKKKTLRIVCRDVQNVSLEAAKVLAEWPGVLHFPDMNVADFSEKVRDVFYEGVVEKVFAGDGPVKTRK